MAGSGQATIYEQLGGKPAFDALVDYFYANLLLDRELQPYFEGIDIARLRNHQAQFLASVCGGPEYRGRSLKEAHAGRGITDAAFQKVAGHLVGAMTHFNVPAEHQEKIVEIVGAVKDQIVE